MNLNYKLFLALIMCCFCVYLFAEKNHCNQLFKTQKENPGNYWVPLYKSSKDTINWESNTKSLFPNDGWQINNEELILLAGRKGGDIRTKKMYSDFEFHSYFLHNNRRQYKIFQ